MIFREDLKLVHSLHPFYYILHITTEVLDANVRRLLRFMVSNFYSWDLSAPGLIADICIYGNTGPPCWHKSRMFDSHKHLNIPLSLTQLVDFQCRAALNFVDIDGDTHKKIPMPT